VFTCGLLRSKLPTADDRMPFHLKLSFTTKPKKRVPGPSEGRLFITMVK
jgi:hypothetical protein